MAPTRESSVGVRWPMPTGQVIWTRGAQRKVTFFRNGNAVSWNSKCRQAVATSSTKAEYMSLYSATQKAIWLQSLLKDLAYFMEAVTTIYQNNQECIVLMKNPVYHTRTKHIDIKFNFLREKVAYAVLSLEYKPTEDDYRRLYIGNSTRQAYQVPHGSEYSNVSFHTSHASQGRVLKK